MFEAFGPVWETFGNLDDTLRFHVRLLEARGPSLARPTHKGHVVRLLLRGRERPQIDWLGLVALATSPGGANHRRIGRRHSVPAFSGGFFLRHYFPMLVALCAPEWGEPSVNGDRKRTRM